MVRKLANGEVHTTTHEYKEGECLQSVAAAAPKYKTGECETLVLRTLSALKNDNWDLSKCLEGSESAFLFIAQYTDLAHYAKAFHKLENPKYKTERKHPINDDSITDTEKARMQGGIVYSLVQTWLYENKHTFGSKGGDWACGVHSGVCADFCLKIKLNEENMKNSCSSPISRKRIQSHPLTHYYLGVRLTHRCLLTVDIDGVRTQKEYFQVSNMEAFLKPTTVGQTSILDANYGNPFVSHIESKYERKLAAEREEAKFFREEAKRVAKEQKLHEVHLENLARQSEEKERKLKARMEAELDETIIAYNAQVQRTKDIIAFNRKHIADPLVKRIEAKEAEQHRIEAERRHDVKMKQKEAERLAKHAAKR